MLAVLGNGRTIHDPFFSVALGGASLALKRIVDLGACGLAGFMDRESQGGETIGYLQKSTFATNWARCSGVLPRRRTTTSSRTKRSRMGSRCSVRFLP